MDISSTAPITVSPLLSQQFRGQANRYNSVKEYRNVVREANTRPQTGLSQKVIQGELLKSSDELLSSNRFARIRAVQNETAFGSITHRPPHSAQQAINTYRGVDSVNREPQIMNRIDTVA